MQTWPGAGGWHLGTISPPTHALLLLFTPLWPQGFGRDITGENGSRLGAFNPRKCWRTEPGSSRQPWPPSLCPFHGLPRWPDPVGVLGWRHHWSSSFPLLAKGAGKGSTPQLFGDTDFPGN